MSAGQGQQNCFAAGKVTAAITFVAGFYRSYTRVKALKKYRT